MVRHAQCLLLGRSKKPNYTTLLFSNSAIKAVPGLGLVGPWVVWRNRRLGGADAGPGLWAQGIEAALALLQHHRRWGIGESSTPAWWE